MKHTLLVISMLWLCGAAVSAAAQEVDVPDPGLNSAIREALQKTRDPITQADMLSLIVLDASSRDVTSTEGLQTALNLATLDLRSNLLANLTVPATLTDLATLDLSFNVLTNCSFPSGLTNLAKIILAANGLGSLVLPADSTALSTLDVSDNRLTSFNLPSGMTNLNELFLPSNQLTNLSLPPDLYALSSLDLSDNQLTRLSLTDGLTNLSNLFLSGNPLATLQLPETLASTKLAGLVAALLNQGVIVITSPPTPLDVSIPDPGLDAAIREALNKPAGPLTDQDLLSLTNLDAQRRSITNLSGLEAARNLAVLNLESNRLGTFSFPSTLTNLKVLNLSLNSLTICTLADGLTNLAALILQDNNLTNFSLPSGLTGLTNLDLDGNQIAEFHLPSNLTSLASLDLGFNLLTEFSLPGGLKYLTNFFIAGNLLTNVTLPEGMGQLTELYLAENQLTSIVLPPGMTNLLELNLFFNALTNLSLPGDIGSLTSLDLDFNQLTALDLPSNLIHLGELHVRSNLLTSFSLPAGMAALRYLDIGENHISNVTLPTDLHQLRFLRCSGNAELRNLTLPVGLTNLTGIFLRNNQLTNLVLPTDLSHLADLDVLGNQLASFTLPAGLTSLTNLFLSGNQLASLTLPPDMTQLVWLVLDGNPLTALVLSAPLAAGNLRDTVAALRNQGVSVFTYPLTIQLVRPRLLTGAFQFGITGPPGVYLVQGSTDLGAWTQLGVKTNALGSITFNDTDAHLYPLRFYRALLPTPPTNMVFVSPNTFVMGSPTNELNRDLDEGPQTQVTLTHGFWIGKYEVTQQEYLSVMNTNPSVFPGDLDRPVSNVSWLDATNYCWKLTLRELTAGQIPPGSRYRLPTEAEWECAARAGTSTRFSYGDDLDSTSLTNYAWYSLNAELTVHAVGEKLPNSWGLYDMEGNVWEWCQDWFGPLPGRVQIDPTGPASSPDGLKVMRGGAYDYPDSACRSASRFSFGASPFLSDSDLGFRVVLEMGQL